MMTGFLLNVTPCTDILSCYEPSIKIVLMDVCMIFILQLLHFQSSLPANVHDIWYMYFMNISQIILQICQTFFD